MLTYLVLRRAQVEVEVRLQADEADEKRWKGRPQLCVQRRGEVGAAWKVEG